MTDSELITLVLQGDLTVFKTLIERYEKKISNVIFGMLGPDPQCEDIGQEVFIRFYHSLREFRG